MPDIYDKQISELEDGGNIQPQDVLVIARNGHTMKLLAEKFNKVITSVTSEKAGTITTVTINFSDGTNFSFQIADGEVTEEAMMDAISTKVDKASDSTIPFAIGVDDEGLYFKFDE